MAELFESKEENYQPYTQNFYNPFIWTKNYSKVNGIVEVLLKLEKSRVRRNVSMYVVNLILNNGKVAVSRSKGWFNNHPNSRWHTYRSAIKSQDLLQELGFVKISRGYRTAGFSKGFSSTLEVTDKFKVVFLKEDIKKEIISSRLEVDVSNLYDILVDSNGYKGVGSDREKAISMDNIGKEITTALQSHFLKKGLEDALRNMSKLNTELFSKITLGFDDGRVTNTISNVYLTRIFKEDGCGRIYQQYASSYQQLPKEDRKHLTINGLKTVEVDYSNLHINLLYHKVDKDNPVEDSYMAIVKVLLGKPDPEIREIIKLYIIIAINAKNFRSSVSAMNLKHSKMVRKLKEKNIKFKDIINAFGKVHPDIQKFLNSNISFELMLKDSTILENVLLRLNKEGILGLPLHDSIICQKGFERRVKEIMIEEYKNYTRLSITVKISAE